MILALPQTKMLGLRSPFERLNATSTPQSVKVKKLLPLISVKERFQTRSNMAATQLNIKYYII